MTRTIQLNDFGWRSTVKSTILRRLAWLNGRTWCDRYGIINAQVLCVQSEFALLALSLQFKHGMNTQFQVNDMHNPQYCDCYHCYNHVVVHHVVLQTT